MNVRRLVPLALILAFTTAATADEVVLNGGTRLTGVLLDKGTPAEGPTKSGSPMRLLLPKGDLVSIDLADVKKVAVDPAAPAAGKYLRYVEPKDGKAGGLEVAVMHFVHPKGGPRIDLVSAVHIADKSYFKNVQAVLETSDLVLYEAVKSKDADVADFKSGEGDEDNVVRQLQRMVAEWFGLAFQLEEIVYTRPHFVHADLTLEEFNAEAGAAPESDTEGEGEPDPKPDAGKKTAPQLPAGFGDLKSQLEMLKGMGPLMKGPMGKQVKRMLARTMGTSDVAGMLQASLPEATTELLLDKRNAVVIERIKEYAPKTKGAIAVFYGAGHMADIEKTLVEKMGYRRAGGRWMSAWAID